MGNAVSNLVLPFRDALVADRRHLHRNPELSFQEHATARWVADRLRGLGLDVAEGVGRCGVLARLRGADPGPVVALRADMDALPIDDRKDVEYRSWRAGAMHGCGHDGHVAMLLAVAEILRDLRQDVRGEVVFLFQPAEEQSPGGAEAMIADGSLDGVDAIFGMHLWVPLPTGQLGVRPGPITAAGDRFSVTVDGTGGHAGAPHLSVDSVVVAARIVCDLQLLASRCVDPLEPLVVTVGQLHAGTQNNVIAAQATLDGTVRTFSPEVRELVPERMEKLIAAACEGAGAAYDLSYVHGHPSVVNDPAAVEAVRRVVHDLDRIEPVEMPPSMAGEDFSYYLHRVPGCFFFIGAGNPDTAAAHPHHHPLFDIDENALELGVEAMLATYFEHTSDSRKGNDEPA